MPSFAEHAQDGLAAARPRESVPRGLAPRLRGLCASVTGPVERRALARLASVFLAEVVGFMMMIARLHFVPRRLKSSRGSNEAGRRG